MKGGAVVVRLAVDFLAGDRIGPVLGAGGEADEVGGGDRHLFVVQPAG